MRSTGGDSRHLRSSSRAESLSRLLLRCGGASARRGRHHGRAEVRLEELDVQLDRAESCLSGQFEDVFYAGRERPEASGDDADLHASESGVGLWRLRTGSRPVRPVRTSARRPSPACQIHASCTPWLASFLRLDPRVTGLPRRPGRSRRAAVHSIGTARFDFNFIGELVSRSSLAVVTLNYRASGYGAVGLSAARTRGSGGHD